MFANASAVKLREYERIFTGTNQETGYVNPVLDFVSDTKLQVFPSDRTTYFHYPMTALSATLSGSDLIQAGAVASNIPYRSDKIWKKMGNYRTSSIWGESQPVGKQTGVWLCSWLSGNMMDLSSTPVWMDRWYNSGYIDATTAMFISQPLSALVVDIPSEMTFEKGTWYKYFHVGNEHNTNIVNSLTGENNTHLKLRLDQWSEFPVDLSPYNNTSEIQNYTEDIHSSQGVNVIEHPEKIAFHIADNQYCQVVHNSCYSLSGEFSYSIWVHADNWNNIQGSHILSKDFRGGWSLKYDNGFYTPIIFLADRNGKMIFLNSDGKILKSHNLPGNSTPIAAVIDNNLFIWVLDNGVYNGLKHLYKVDYNGDIRDSINFTSAIDLKHVTIDLNDNLWVLATDSVSGFDNYVGNLITSYSISSSYNYIDVNLNNQISAFETSFTFDNSGNFVSVAAGEILGYQSDDSLWILNGTNAYIKKDLTGTVLLSGTVGFSNAVSSRNLCFTNEFVDDRYIDYVWFMQDADQSIFKYDTDGNLIQRISLATYDFQPAILGDLSGYQRSRKFNYAHYNKQPQIKADIHLNTTVLSGAKYTLTIPTSAISNDWHMFTFTFNPTSINLYMDSMLRSSQTFSNPMYVNYQYDNPLLIGADAGRNRALFEEIDSTQLSFVGQVDDLRIYDIVLNNSDIRHLYFTKFDFKDVNWNMPIGNQSYLEEIERFFKFKLTGSKSPYYNIKLIGLGITDGETKTLIENIIRNTIKKVAPAYTELYKIIWE